MSKKRSFFDSLKPPRNPRISGRFVCKIRILARETASTTQGSCCAHFPATHRRDAQRPLMEGTVVAEGRLYRRTQSPLYIIRELSAARLTGGLLTPPALCATSPNARRASGEALAGTCCEGALAAQARRAADSRPYGKCGSLVRDRRGRCLHRPVPRSGLSWRVQRLRETICIAAPKAPLERCPGRQVCSAKALWSCVLMLPPAGNFSPQKSSQNAPGAAAPGPPLGCAACIPGSGIARAAALHRAVPSAAPCPFKASRGTVKSQGRYGYAAIL